MKNTTTHTLSEIKADFERLSGQMTPEVRTLFSLTFKLFEVLILSLPKKKATSANSSLPPSQDPHRPKEKAPGTGKKPGGQKGHKGSSLAMDPKPDIIIPLPAVECDDCGLDLTNTPVDNISRHQVIDIKFKKFIVENKLNTRLAIAVIIKHMLAQEHRFSMGQD